MLFPILLMATFFLSLDSSFEEMAKIYIRVDFSFNSVAIFASVYKSLTSVNKDK